MSVGIQFHSLTSPELPPNSNPQPKGEGPRLRSSDSSEIFQGEEGTCSDRMKGRKQKEVAMCSEEERGGGIF